VSVLLVPVRELRRRTAARRPWQGEVPAVALAPAQAAGGGGCEAGGSGPPDLAVGAARLSDEVPVRLDLVLESLPDAVVASGRVEAGWSAPCHRCSEDLDGPISVEVREVFESRPTEGESYPLGHEALDLAPMVRELLLLELPLTARCPFEDEDPCPLSGYSATEWSGPSDPPVDPRWSALEQVHFDDAAAAVEPERRGGGRGRDG
jgi:uncharacterized metal-binding protein YceD (DUF177 family)